MPGNFLKSPAWSPRLGRKRFAQLRQEDAGCDNRHQQKGEAEKHLASAHVVEAKETNAVVLGDTTYIGAEHKSHDPSRDRDLCIGQQDDGVDDATRCTACSSGSSSSASDERLGGVGAAMNHTTASSTAAPKKVRQPRSYPILAPLSSAEGNPTFGCNAGNDNNMMYASLSPTSHDEYELHSLQVEMAKSAFLRDPCEEHWGDLVDSLRTQSAERQQVILRLSPISDHSGDAGSSLGYDGRPDAADIEESEKVCWEDSADINMALSRLENGFASLEGKVVVDHDETDDVHEMVPTDAPIGRESDVTPSSAATPSPKAASSADNKANSKAYVLGEVSKWEDQIDKFDQRHVNVVAAATSSSEDEVDGACENAAWKAGRVVEEVQGEDNDGVMFVV